LLGGVRPAPMPRGFRTQKWADRRVGPGSSSPNMLLRRAKWGNRGRQNCYGRASRLIDSSISKISPSCLIEKERRDRPALHLFDCSGSRRRAERARSDRGVRPSVKRRKYGRSSQSRAGLPQRRFPMPPGVVLYEIGVKPKWIGRFAWIEWPLVMKIIRPPVHNFFLGPASNARSGASLGRRESSRKEMASQPWDGFEIFL
jgi:hypothetical protein